jgi:hypothetical protein
VGADQRRGEAKHTIAGGPQVLIPVLIEMRAPLVKAAIHFDDQANAGSDEIRDVAANDDLTAKCDATDDAVNALREYALHAAV